VGVVAVVDSPKVVSHQIKVVVVVKTLVI